MTQVIETALSIPCEGSALQGVLTLPKHRPAQDVAVVFVVGGPQYRVGSHRQFVHLARDIAAAGHPALRFDVRGMGDSDGTPRGFEAVADDIDAAIQAVCSQTGARQVVLWGLCDGASAALLYLYERTDSRIVGLILANPWVRSEQGLAKTQLRHYYGRRLLSPNFWSELLRGRVTLQALSDLLRNLRLAALDYLSPKPAGNPEQDFRERMAAAWLRFGRPILLLVSENDYTAKEFIGHASEHRAWQGALGCPTVRRVDLANTDHTFSSRAERATVARICIEWLGSDALQRGPLGRTP